MRTLILLAICAVTLSVNISHAQSNRGCVAYGDTDTDFTWLLCPNGQKYERQYQYFGMWSSYYTVPAATGKCLWQSPRWTCRDAKFVCSAGSCQKE